MENIKRQNRNCGKRRIYLFLCFAVVISVPVFGGFFYYNNQIFAQKLIAAIEYDDIQEVERLLEYPFGNVNSTPYRAKFVAKFLSNNFGGYAEFTPLLMAIHRENNDIIALLVENGANVNNTGFRNSSPFMTVCELRRVLSLLDFLLKTVLMLIMEVVF